MNIPSIYKPFAGLVFLFAVVSVLNLPILATLWRHSFDDGTYSHAYLIPIITLYLYFKLSANGLLAYRESISYVSLALLIGSGFLLFVTSNAQISIGYWLSFLAVLTFGVMSLFRFNWYVLFPTLFLIFIFPLWGLLTEVLQAISVTAVTYMMSFTGIPTYVEAQYITIPAGVFEIADGCSGLRYIIVSLAISTLFIFMYINNTKKAATFLTVAILGALLTNWIRITALILIGEYTDMQSSLMEDHNTFGWYLYIPFMFLLFMWGNKLANHDLLSTPENNTLSPLGSYPKQSNVLLLLVAITVSSTTLKSFFIPTLPNNADVIALTEIQPTIERYTSVEQLSSNASDLTPMVNLKYFFNGVLDNGKPTGFGNDYLPKGWQEVDQEIVGKWRYIRVANRRNAALVRYTYEINKQQMASPVAFKKQRLIEALTGKSETYMYWQFFDCLRDCDAEKKHATNNQLIIV
ncbi:exosortase [Pseudocolwellia sp. HL-MZ7]|uniref:exosortase n=1 Tax=Pseudocolwellia sp. HL-MZ7 TaxID=3400627 RepID=UPI003CF769EC